MPGASACCPRPLTAFRDGVRVPQLGWNRVTPETAARCLQDGDAYFANSYRLDEVAGRVERRDHRPRRRFVAALERGSVLACQFHPELSGAWGAGADRALARAAAEVA